MLESVVYKILFRTVPTWDLQLVVECVSFKSTQPGRVFLQVPRFLLKSTHGCCELIHLPHETFVLFLLKQLAAFSSQQFLHIFSKFLQRNKKKKKFLLSIWSLVWRPNLILHFPELCRQNKSSLFFSFSSFSSC